jgi:hypothetical protein
MTNEQINAAIHAALGNPIGCPRCSDPECAYNSGPNYCTDLNAMHEAEKVLSDESWLEYTNMVRKIFGPIRSVPAWGKSYLHLTARQRAEAFLRTLGKWEVQND